MERRVAVEPAGPDDVGSIVASYAWLFSPPGVRPSRWDEAEAARSVERAIASAHSEVLVARTDGRIVGFCTIYLDLDSVRFGLRAWVEDLAVDPGFRSRGIGKQLLDEAKAWAKRHDATHLSLESGERRLDAHRFYEREKPSRASRSFVWEL